MKKFRLKKDAVKFFKADLSTEINDFDFWNRKNVDPEALEEVEDCYISYGIASSETSRNTAGWSDGKGSRFHFTLNFPSHKFHEYDQFSKNKMTRELMNKIQKVANDFYLGFDKEGM
jgi:hypothetical protein